MTDKFNVLIIEDNDEEFYRLKDGLTDSYYKIWRAASGKEALKLAKEVYFVAVIMEGRLVDLDTVDMIKRIKKIDFKINIIVLTSSALADLNVEALRAGAFAYLTKPINLEEAKLILKKAIENSCLLIQVGKRKYYQELSILDGLTGVYNHRHFHEMLDWHIAHLRRYPQSFSLAIIDIDNFKKYNDTHGHLEGDKVLYNTAQLLVRATRDEDLVFRYGGEEFAVVLPRTPQQGAQRVGERFVQEARAQLAVTISVGLATFPEDAQVKSALIENADKALYRAKRLGKDRMCIFSAQLDR